MIGMLWFSFMVGTWLFDSFDERLTAWVPASCNWPETAPRLVPIPLYPIRFYWLISEKCLLWWLKFWWVNFCSRDVFLAPKLPAYFLFWNEAELLAELVFDPEVPFRFPLFHKFPFSLECYLLYYLLL